MRKRNIFVAALLAAAATGQAQAALYVFGDSLVDSGNVALVAPNETNPAFGYYQGRFSNGPNYADILSQRLFGQVTTAYGVPVTPPGTTPAFYFPGGNNFAWGGAQARDVTGDRIPSFSDQLALFAGSGKTLTADDIVLVTFGGNDIKALISTPMPDFTATYEALTSGLTYLAQVAGARQIIVTGQANIGQIPTVTGNGALPENSYVSGLAATVNSEFKTRTETADAAFASQITFFDLLAFQKELLLNATANGYTNVTNRCINPATGEGPNGAPASPTPNCTGYLYFDNTHPTKEAHVDIADGIQARLAEVNAVPEPATWATMMLGFGLVGATVRRRRRLRTA